MYISPITTPIGNTSSFGYAKKAGKAVQAAGKNAGKAAAKTVNAKAAAAITKELLEKRKNLEAQKNFISFLENLYSEKKICGADKKTLRTIEKEQRHAEAIKQELIQDISKLEKKLEEMS